MKKLAFGLVGLAFLAACTNNPKGNKATTTDEVADSMNVSGEQYVVDAAASSVHWTGSKVTGSHHGTVAIQSGDIYVSDGKVTGGEFEMDMKSITNHDMKADPENKGKLEGHLKSDDFFAADKFPTSKFSITKIDYKADNKIEVSGNLTLKGITKNITFNADITQNTAETIAATADFNINRKDWGVVYEGMKDDLIADEINFKIELVAKK